MGEKRDSASTHRLSLGCQLFQLCDALAKSLEAIHEPLLAGSVHDTLQVIPHLHIPLLFTAFSKQKQARRKTEGKLTNNEAVCH